MKRGITVAACVLVVVVVALIAQRFVLHVAFNESLYVKPYSLDYFLAIHSPTIRSFPTIAMVGQREFHSDCGDGPKRPSNSVMFTSSADTQTLWRAIDTYVTSRGYSRGSDKDTVYGGLVFRKGDNHLEIGLSRGTNGLTGVSVVEIE